MLLATWFKRALRQSLLGQIYVNRGKVKGIDQDPRTNEEIYQQYLKAYKKGVFNYIKEEPIDGVTASGPRKYFSGGTGDYAMAERDFGMAVVKTTSDRGFGDGAMKADELPRRSCRFCYGCGDEI